jgi:DNA helicase-2/ATP-dependent DNA helicase PcrA
MGWANKVRQSPAAVLDTPVTTTPLRKSTEARVWSEQQHAIFDWFKSSRINKRLCQHLIVRARAGTGKTTTIVEGVNHAPEENIILCAFNKRIAVELEARVNNPNVTVKTLHAIGFGIIREYVRKVRVAKGDARERALSMAVCGPNTPDTILKLVSKLHTKAREIVPYANTPFLLEPLAEQFECAPEYFWQAQGYDLQYVLDKACEAMNLAATQDVTEIDFADMIFLPVRRGWAAPRYNLVVVDEAQDMTAAQLMLARQIMALDGRVCVVGDDHQAIYGFRGADSKSLDRLKSELAAGELRLTATYRCGRKIVTEASRFVDDFVAGPNNSEGEVLTIVREDLTAKVGYGDFILSRLNAPLAGYAMQLLREKRRARIAGRDIGQHLKTLVRKLAKGAQDVETFLVRVREHEEKTRKRYLALKWESKLAELEDMVETVSHIAEGCNTVGEMEGVIDLLFTDDGLGDKGMITLSSVHKAKGLEADKVFVLAWTLRTGKSQEEDNIHYVAVTRARDVLTYVQ